MSKGIVPPVIAIAENSNNTAPAIALNLIHSREDAVFDLSV